MKENMSTDKYEHFTFSMLPMIRTPRDAMGFTNGVLAIGPPISQWMNEKRDVTYEWKF
jgi:hypothetical protein